MEPHRRNLEDFYTHLGSGAQGLSQAEATLRDSRAVQLLVAKLVPSNVLLLAADDDVPADCRLIEAVGVRVNTTNLTSESKPMARKAAAEPEE